MSPEMPRSRLLWRSTRKLLLRVSKLLLARSGGLRARRTALRECKCEKEKQFDRHPACSFGLGFFERFYPWCRTHGIDIEEGVERSQDHNRAVKMNEKTVEKHFNGEFGLAAELIDTKIMDAETKIIGDPRRILNADETPQPVDAPQKGRRPKVAKRTGQTVRKATVTSKENASVNMAWDLGGHLYGLQLILKLKELHSDLVAKGPPGAAYFDGECDLARKQTRSCTFSRSADGMQTQKTFMEYLHQLDGEITQHSDAAVAAGGEPIQRPVVLCLDNHASRYSAEVCTH